MLPQRPILLEYGRSAPLWRRRRVWAGLLILVVLVAGGFIVWPQFARWYARWAYRQEAQRWYAAAAAWSEPATKLKYTEDPADAPGGKFKRSYGPAGSGTFTGFRSFGGSFIDRRPLFDSSGNLFLAASPDEVMLFMHERTTSAGLTRLIALCNPRFNGKFLRIECDVIGLINGDYRILRGGAPYLDMTGICGPGEIRIFAGQADPKDKSRFSIPFQARRRRGWIDGIFKTGESSSTVELTVRMEGEGSAK